MATKLPHLLASGLSLLFAIGAAHAETSSDLGSTRRQPHVVGGSQVPDGKWPDAAAVSGNGEVFCTGVLIAPDVVLTAGHCIGGIDEVLLATNDYLQGGEAIPVMREVAYPQWWQSYDIGLLVLAQTATTTPRSIASGCVRERYLTDGAPVAIVGYGAIDEFGEEYTSELREATATVTDADCSSTERGCTSAISPNGEIGAGGGGIDSCFGDSGGPLYLITEIGDFLIGNTSRGWDDVSVPCAEGGIYTRPDAPAVLQWIQSETGKAIPEPTCNVAPTASASTAMIEVESGKSEIVTITVADADPSDTHTLSMSTEPEHGTVDVAADGTVTYTAAEDYVGPDRFVITATDSGVPPLSGQVEVQVTVVEPPPDGCGCRSATRTGSGAPLVLLALWWVTRRRGDSALHSD